MEKKAQRRGRWEKLKENLNLGGVAAEKFSPTFAALMDKLREADDSIRSVLLEGDVSLKDSIKSARSNFNRREYMASVADLTKFHDKAFKVAEVLKKLELDVESAHGEFIFGNLPGDTLEGLKSLREKFESKAEVKALLKKEAGIRDLWYALTSERGKALRGWEKRYPTKMRKLKTDTGSLISKSEGLFNALLSALKDMSTARNQRKVDEYLKSSANFLSRFNNYNEEFKKYYFDNIKNFVEKTLAEENKVSSGPVSFEKTPSKNPASMEAPKTIKTEEMNLGEQSVQPVSNKSQVSLHPSLIPPTPKTELEGKVESDEDPFPLVQKQKQVVQVDPTSSGKAQTIPNLLNPNIPKPPKMPQDLLKQVEKEQQQEAKTVPPGKLMQQSPKTEEEPGMTEIDNNSPNTEIQDGPDTSLTSSGPNTKKDSVPTTMRSANLINRLQVLSGESPKLLALEIKKFAKEEKDLRVKSELLKIVEKILNG